LTAARLALQCGHVRPRVWPVHDGGSKHGERPYPIPRLAITFPIIGPHVEEDSVTKGFELPPYMGSQFGMRVF